jgi:hypothetical protein
MPPRTASKILAEWHELAMQREEATDAELAEAITARIEQVRREYIEGTPPEPTPGTDLPDAETSDPEGPDRRQP